MTIAFVQFDITPWIGIPLGVLVGMLASIVIGLPTFRLRGHYFALSMLAYPLAMLYVFEWMGFQEVSLPMKREAPALYVQFNDPRAYMALALVLLVVCMIVSLHVERSRFGMSLTAIKQNEPAASAAGINPLRWKMLALIVSAGMAAAVGGLYAVVLLVVTPQTMFGVLVSAQALIIPMFGGIGVFWGPVIGAAVLVPLAETLNAQLGNVLPGIQGVVYGVAIILITLLAPEGIYWTIRDRLTSRRAARVPAPSTAGAVAIPAAAPLRQFGHSAAAGEALLSLNGISRAFGGLKAVDDVALTIKAGTISRHHRTEWRRQDHSVQCHQRVFAGRHGQHRIRGCGTGWSQASRNLPARRGPYVSSRTLISAHDRSGKCDRGRVCRHAKQRRGRAPRHYGA